MVVFDKLTPPTEGEKATITDGKLNVPDNPIVPYLDGDGIGPDILNAVRPTVDAAVEKAYGGKRKISWFKVYAGDEARAFYHPEIKDEDIESLPIDQQRDLYLPKDTIKAMKEYLINLKGPLTTPIGKGFRSLNVGIRQILDLYACLRPVRYYEGVPTRIKYPEEVDFHIFRENSEDVYSGVEFDYGTEDQKKVLDFLNNEMGKSIREDSGIGIKPISITGSKRLVRASIKYAIEKGLPSVTLVHKGNIQKFTEGRFKDWGYEVAKEEFRDYIVTEDELWDNFDGKMPEGKILVKDRIADIIFQHILLRSSEFSVLTTMNLNGDYISDAAAALVGGVGMAPGANINYDTGVIVAEATHGTAPKYTNMNKVNPGSVLLSASIMLEYMGWDEAADLIDKGLKGAISAREVTYDLARQLDNVTPISTSEFGEAIVRHM
ncbi:MAG: isocitrate dehydrogenase (NADP(+)) [Candidatus Kariarchaeaceae archaeon]|jgi:isocitrate dehydrogenase